MFKKIAWFEVVTPITLIIVLLGIRLFEGYLFFHVLAELFSVIVGVLITIITYYMYKFTRNDLVLFIGIGFFWTAALSLFHMLSYKGMHVYSDVLAQDPATTLWIFTQILQITILLAAPFVRFDTISPRRVFGLFTVVAIGIYLGTFGDFFPRMYVEETGLTSIKIALEYSVMFLSMIAIIVYNIKQEKFHPYMYKMIILSLVFNIIAEGCFTLYTDLYGVMNVAGHIFKLLSYWMIFLGVVVSALKEPFSMMAKVSSTYDAIPVPVVVVDSKGIIRQVNQAIEKYSDIHLDEFIGKDNHTLLHPFGLNPQECSVCQAIREENFGTIEVSFEDKYKQYTISPIKIEGEVTGILQICIDLTAQRVAEQKLLKEATLLKTIINTVPVRLFWKDKDSVYLGGNDLFAQDAGLFNGAELIGKRDEQFWKDQAQAYREDDMSVIQSGISKINYEEQQQRDNKDSNWLRSSKVPLREEKDGSIIGVVGVYNDITEMRKAEFQLKESERFYRTIFTSVREAIIILENQTVIDCNELALSLFDAKKENFIGKNIFDLPHNIECRKGNLENYLDQAHQGEFVITECSLQHHHAPNEIKIIEFTLSGFSDQNENKLIMIARDLSQHIKEERIFRMNTRQAQMGEMISMIAHQWRQPLAIINAIISQMRLEEMMKDENDLKLINNLIKVEEQSIHLSQTISDYRDFFDPDKPKVHFNLSPLIENALSLIDHTLKSHAISVKKRYLQDPQLFTYRNEVLQVLIALLKNSIDAFVEKPIAESHIWITLDTDDEYTIITIRDNAGGITPEIINKLFIPYFTTKTEYNGTGLGLYMSMMIIKDHCHGMIDVSSQGDETTFTIRLPYIKERE